METFNCKANESIIKVKFGEWAVKWLNIYKKPHVSENTFLFTYRNTVLNHLIPFFNDFYIDEIKSVDIQEFLAINNHFSESVLEKMVICLRSIFETAIDNDLCIKNPARKVCFSSQYEKHIKKVYTSEEIVKIKELSYGQMNDVVILLETGLRRGELLGLRWDDVNFENNLLTIKRSIAVSKEAGGFSINPPKWDSYRTIPLFKQSVIILKNTLHQGDYVFSKNKNVQLPNTWSDSLAKYMKSLPIEIPRLTAHELRHTYGTNLRREGIDIYTIQKLMGHKDINMTAQLYVHNEIEALKKSMKSIID